MVRGRYHFLSIFGVFWRHDFFLYRGIYSFIWDRTSLAKFYYIRISSSIVRKLECDWDEGISKARG